MKKQVELKKQEMNNRGITLIALVITIIVLLILAGVSIATLTGDNGILTKANSSKVKQIKAEMKEKLIIALDGLQIEKLGKATRNDITEDWVNEKLKEYKARLIDNETEKIIKMQKNGITGRFKIDLNLNVIEMEYDGSIEFLYKKVEDTEIGEKITIYVQDEEYGLEKIELPNREAIEANGTKEEIQIKDYIVEIGKEYKIKITSKNGKVREESILIDCTYNINLELGEGLSIDNEIIEISHNQSYTAKIIEDEEYIVENLTLTMGGVTLTEGVDIISKTINIEKVTGDIVIKAESKRRNGLIDYWMLTDNLKNKISNASGDLIVCKGSMPQFSEDGAFLNNIVLSTQEDYEINNTFSIVFQIKATEINTWSNVIGKHIKMVQDCRATGLWMHNDTSKPLIVTGNKNYINVGRSLYRINELTSIAITHTGTVLTVYSNGVKIADKNCSNTPIVSPFFIGGSAASGTYVTAGYSEGYSPGYYKNIAIYNRALSDEEIANYIFE